MRKSCYCHTCKKAFEPGGIAGHRMAHRNRKEKCTIEFTHGKISEYDFSEPAIKEKAG